MFSLNMIGLKVIIFVIDTGDTCISSNQYRIVFEIHGIAHHYGGLHRRQSEPQQDNAKDT